MVPIGFLASSSFVGPVVVWVSDRLLPGLIFASEIAFVICLFVLLPLCVFRRNRSWVGTVYVFVSYLFGSVLFIFSGLFVVFEWGYIGLVIGLCLAGFGVVPVAFLAALVHARWSTLFELAIWLFLTFGTRILGLQLIPPEAVSEEQEAEAMALIRDGSI